MTKQVVIPRASVSVLQALCEEAAENTRTALDSMKKIVKQQRKTRKPHPAITEREELLRTLGDIIDVLNRTETLHATLRQTEEGR